MCNTWNLGEDFDWRPIGEACMVEYPLLGTGTTKAAYEGSLTTWSMNCEAG